MQKPIKHYLLMLLSFAGINRAIGYGVLARIWGLLAGPVTLVIVATRFTKEQQGFYYTISSLLALQIFFELGLTVVIAQFVSHEFAFLTWGARGKIEGDSRAYERCKSILSKSTKWFGISSILLIIFLIPSGLMFFSREQSAVTFSWRLPWILAVFGIAANLFIVPFFAFIMGSGDVKTVNHREMVGGVIGSCISWVVIWFHGGLYAIFAISAGYLVVTCWYLLRQKPELLKLAFADIFQKKHAPKIGETISWIDEVWPMQWRIALSWISGYFIFQLFTPILFHYHGSVVAGQMGLTLSAASALMGVSMTIMNTRSPEFGKLIAVQEWEKLDATFFRVFYQTVGFTVFGMVFGWLAIYLLQQYHQIGQRFIPANYAFLLLASAVVQNVISSFAVYLRAHKREPLLFVSVLAAVLHGTTVWLFGKYYSAPGIALSYFLVNTLIIMPIVFIVWLKSRNKWHDEAQLSLGGN